MKRLMPLVMAMLVLSPVYARGQDQKPPEPNQPTPKQVEPPDVQRASAVTAPTGERDPVDLPRDKMNEVLKEIGKSDFREAGQELKKAVGAMQVAADTSLGEAIKTNILRSVVELSSRAEGLHSGGTVTAEEMTPMFSRALQALSAHHAALAEAHFQKGNNLLTGQDLRAAVLDVNQAVVWGNVKPTADETNRLNQAGRLAKNLIDLKKVDKPATEKSILDLQQWIQTLRARLPKAEG
jgi:hypothetical protein